MNYETLEKVNLDELRRSELGRNLSFSEAIPYIEKVITELLFFKGRDHVLMDTEKAVIEKISNDLIRDVNHIKTFNHEPNESIESAQNRRNSITHSIKETFKLFTHSALSISNNLKLGDDQTYQRKIEQLDKILNNAEQQFNTKLNTFENTFNASTKAFQEKLNIFDSNTQHLLDTINNKIVEVDKAKTEVKNFTAKKLVEKYGEIFKEQSIKNYTYGLISLGVFILSLIILIIISVRFFFPFLEKLENIRVNNIQETVHSTTTPITKGNFDQKDIGLEYTITFLVSRLVILGVFSLLLKESLKNYNVNMHLYNLNLHRQNALESFDILISNTEHPDTRDKIIKELAQTIYSNQDDGYISTDKKNMNITEITEIIKAIRG